MAAKPEANEDLKRERRIRAVKALLVILPFVVIILWLLSLLRGTPVVCEVDANYDPAQVRETVRLIVIFLATYFLVLLVIWRVLFYVASGGAASERKESASGKPLSVSLQGRRAAAVVPFVILLIIIAIMLLAEFGLISLPKIKLGGTGFGGGFGGQVCHETSAGWGRPCGGVIGGVAVSGLPVPDGCPCPKDTTYSGTTDRVTPGGPYKICVCN